MIKKLYIIRHAETILNKSKILQGQRYDSNLSPEGQRQSSFFFEKCQHLKIEKIYISSLNRSYESVKKIIAKKNIDYEINKNLNEINWGILEGGRLNGKVREQYKKMIQEWTHGNFSANIEGGEDLTQVVNRATEALTYIMSKPHERNVLIVTHSRILKIILCLLLNINLQNQDRFVHKNMCCYLIEYLQAVCTSKMNFYEMSPFSIRKYELSELHMING